MDNRHRIAIVIGALLLAVIAGGVGYNLGISRNIVIADGPGGAHWHYPPFGGYFFAFFFFLFAGILFVRALGGGRRGCWSARHEMMAEWHRREHELREHERMEK